MNSEEVKTSANLFPVHSYFLLQIRGFSSAGRAPALQAGGQRFDPANLHQEIDWNILKQEEMNGLRCFIESLNQECESVPEWDSDAPWKLNIVIMMQLWEGNSKEHFSQVFVKNLKGKNYNFC